MFSTVMTTIIALLEIHLSTTWQLLRTPLLLVYFTVSQGCQIRDFWPLSFTQSCVVFVKFFPLFFSITVSVLLLHLLLFFVSFLLFHSLRIQLVYLSFYEKHLNASRT
uniref:Uncharacterized protein n=1 Tax=Cacopsylla melanoneura TaxID=428564 RepID=A0A8D8QDA3_9HEMI